MFAQIMAQISALTLKTDNLSQQNNDRMEEISTLENKMGFSGEAILDHPELTEAEDIKNLEEYLKPSKNNPRRFGRTTCS